MGKGYSDSPSIIIKGKGNYTGKVIATFNIIPKNLEDEDIEIEDITVIANGKAQRVVPTVKCGNKKLKVNKDFYALYPDWSPYAYEEPGEYPVEVEGRGNYSGIRYITIKVVPNTAVPVKKLKISKIPAQTYQDGKAIEPQPVVKYKGQVLTKDVDYCITYKNNTNVGTAKAIITGMDSGNSIYAGSRVVTFKISGKPISKATISFNKTVAYDGMAKEPQVSVSYGGITLQPEKDYVVEYQNNVNVGKATIHVKGVGGYSGSVKKTFKIIAYDVSGKDITIKDEKSLLTSFEKSGAKPVVKIYYGDRELVQGKDYVLSYKNNKKITSKSEKKAPTVVIKGKGNFRGTRSVMFDIVTKDVADEWNPIIITAPDVVINKKGGYKTKITVKDSFGKKLTLNKDYEIVGYFVGETGTEILQDMVTLTVGTKLRVAIKGLGNYKGTKEAVYKVMQYDLSKVKFKAANQVYTGEEITFDKDDFMNYTGVWIQNSGNYPSPVYGQDYVVAEYHNNIERGKATIVLKGIGDEWGGTKKVTFRIVSKELEWFWNLFG